MHVVFGAGQIGTRLSHQLLARGYRVRVVQRSKPTVVRPDVEHLSGDVTDLGFAAEAGGGASVIYDCLNPQYHQWPTLLLPIARGSLHAAATNRARLVALDCLYAYGKPSGPMNEQMPLLPVSKKGELRRQLRELRHEAHRRGDAQVAVGIASDFFGQNLQLSGFGDRFFHRLLAGKTVECLGNPDQPHSYTWADDVASALITLGERAEAPGQVWHLPTEKAQTTRELVTRLGIALGLPDAKVAKISPVILKVAGLFSNLLREASEMAYQWEQPYVIDDTHFRRTFGQGSTPIQQQVEAVARWAKAHYEVKTRALPAAAQ